MALGPFHFSRNESFVERENRENRSTRVDRRRVSDFRFYYFGDLERAREARGRARGSAEELVASCTVFIHEFLTAVVERSVEKRGPVTS